MRTILPRHLGTRHGQKIFSVRARENLSKLKSKSRKVLRKAADSKENYNFTEKMKRKSGTTKTKKRSNVKIYDGKRTFKKLTVPKVLTLNAVSSLPDRIRLKMVYAESISNTPGTAVIEDIVIRGNSLINCNTHSSTTRDAYSVDQWNNFYQYFRVLASKIEVETINYSGISALNWSIVPEYLVTGIATQSLAQSMPRAKMGEMVPILQRVSKKLTHYATTREIMGLSSAQLQDADYRGELNNVQPTRSWNWHIVVSSVDGTDFVSHAYTVKVIYYVELDGRFPLADSS